MKIRYTNSINIDEFNYIRASVGFSQFHPEQVKAEIEGSTLMIAAYEKEKIIGMASLFWCGGVSASIYVFVVPEYRLNGIEDEMIIMIFNYLKDKLKPGFGIQVDVNAFSRNQVDLYENLGFKISTTEQRGIPMHICLTNQIEITDKMYKQLEYSEFKMI